MKDLQFISIRRDPRPVGFVGKMHAHDYYELVYYPYGQGETIIDGKKYIITDNSFAFIPPHTAHNDQFFAESEAICLLFSGNPDIAHRFFQDSSRIVYRILKEIMNESHLQHYRYREMIQTKLNELFLHATRLRRTTLPKKDLDHIIHYIKENYPEKIDFTDCAEQLNLNYYYFSHKFKKATGMSPQQFLVATRLDAAKKMLTSGTLSCTQIAYQCGFSSSPQFSSLFKKTYSISPLAYRRAHGRQADATSEF